MYSIVSENEFYIAVDKNPGVLSVPSSKGISESRSILGLTLEKKLGSQLYPVHRLDFETQGLIIFAKTASAQVYLTQAISTKQIKKTYRALSSIPKSLDVKSKPQIKFKDYKNELNFIWKSQLVKGKKRTFESAHGKEAITEGELRGIGDDGIFDFYLNPITGRTHQLRYELFIRGMPILGDELYSGENVGHFSSSKFKCIALRAFRLDFSRLDKKERILWKLPETLEINSNFHYNN